MERTLIVSIPEYHEYACKPQSFEDLVSRMDHARQCGLWRICQIDKYTGEIQIEQWLKNNFSDNGANTMLKTIINASAPSAFTPANIIAVDQSVGFTTLATAIAASSTVNAITVGTLIGPAIPSGTKLFIGAGSSVTMNVVLTQAITGAGTYTVNSTTSPATAIPVGASVRYDYTAVPTADLSSLSSPVSYTSALPTSQFTFSNRQVTISNSGSFVYSTTGSPAAVSANYTAAWLTNTNPVSATNQTVLHVVFDNPLVISATSNGQVTIVERL